MKFSKPFKLTFFGVLTLSFFSGLLWFIFDRFVRVTGTFGADHHPLQAMFLRVHGLVALAFLIIFGYLLRDHISPGMKGKKSRRSGLILYGVFWTLILTAAVDLYGPEGILRNAAVSLHLYLGLAIPVFITAHLVARKVTLRQKKRTGADVARKLLYNNSNSCGVTSAAK